MRVLPSEGLHGMGRFAPLLSKRVWEDVRVLGAMRIPGTRTVTSALQVRGWSPVAQFQNDHRVLQRAVWSAPMAGAGRIWAVPFVTALCPAERCHQERGRQHVTLTARARQMGRVVKRWLPPRPIVVVADSRVAALAWLDAVRGAVTVVTRVRLDAAWYAPAPGRQPSHIGRLRPKGRRLPTRTRVRATPPTLWPPVQLHHWAGQGSRPVEGTTATAVWYHSGRPAAPSRWVLGCDPQGKLAAQACRCTDLAVEAHQTRAWLVPRGPVEVPCEAARAQLGVDTPRPGSDNAMARTTPPLWGRDALVTWLARQRLKVAQRPLRTSA